MIWTCLGARFDRVLDLPTDLTPWPKTADRGRWVWHEHRLDICCRAQQKKENSDV